MTQTQQLDDMILDSDEGTTEEEEFDFLEALDKKLVKAKYKEITKSVEAAVSGKKRKPVREQDENEPAKKKQKVQTMPLKDMKDIRSFVFWLNSPTDEEIYMLDAWEDESEKDLKMKRPDNFRYGIAKLKKRKNGLYFIHGYIELIKKRRYSTIRRLLGERYYLERRNGSAKDTKRLVKMRRHKVKSENQWSMIFGEMSHQGKKK